MQMERKGRREASALGVVCAGLLRSREASSARTWVGGWVGGWVEEKEAVGMRCCMLGLGGWVIFSLTFWSTSSRLTTWKMVAEIVAAVVSLFGFGWVGGWMREREEVDGRGVGG